MSGATYLADLILLDLITQYYSVSSMDHKLPHCAVLFSFLFISLVSKYRALHPLLEHSQPMFIHSFI